MIADVGETLEEDSFIFCLVPINAEILIRVKLEPTLLKRKLFARGKSKEKTYCNLILLKI